MPFCVSRLSLYALLLAACLLQACSGSSHKEESVQRLRMCINREPQSLDPRKGAEVISASLHFLLFEGLTRFNNDWMVSPSLAETIEISEDKKTYLFTLREAYWSDGTPVTALDFAYAWKKVLDPTFPSINAFLFYPIKNAESAKRGHCSLDEVGIEAVDERILQITLEDPTPYFLQLTSFSAFFPISHKLDQLDPHWASRRDRRFVCNGPFRIASWQNMQTIHLERNPHYWDREHIFLDKIEMLQLTDGMTALHLFETNQIDLIQFSLCPLPADCFSFLQTKKEFYTEPAPSSAIIAFNTRRFPFNNAKLRRAFSLALNRSLIIDNITQLNEQPAYSLVPPLLKHSNQEQLLAEGTSLEAMELFHQALAELGLSSADQLPALTYLYSSSDINKKTAETIQMQLKMALGVHISPCSLEHNCLMSKLRSHQFEMVQTVWIAQYNDPMNILERFKSSDNAKNFSGWESPHFCELLLQSSKESGEQRMVTLLKAEKILAEEMPVIPLYHLNSSFLKKSYVKNLISPYSSNLCYAWIANREKEEGNHDKNLEFALRHPASTAGVFSHSNAP